MLDWPAGAAAEVVATRTLENRLRGTTIRSEARFGLSVSRTRDATVITTRDVSIAPIRERLEEDTANAALVATMVLPSMTLTREGSVAELRDAAAAQRAIEAALEQATPAAARTSAVWQMAAAAWSSAPALERGATSTVEMMLASLMSRPLVAGRSIEGVGASELIVSGVAVPQRTTLRLDRALPCFDGDAADGCVEVTMRSVPEGTALARVAEAAGIPRLEMTMEATVVTEPRTLLPHRCEVRTRRVYGIEIGGSVRDIEEIENRTWTFTYRRETIRRPDAR